MSEGPSVLVLGGLGFIGKNLVKYLIDYDIAAEIRVADKILTQMGYMNEDFEKVFASDKISFVQADLYANAKKAFDNKRWNIVINLAGLTQYGRYNEEYDLMIHDLRVSCAKLANELGCDKYIEVSTCMVYKNKDAKGEKACKEDTATDAQDSISASHLSAEKDIMSSFPDLPVVIARLPVVYGPADTAGLMRRLICAASYIGSEEAMELPFSDSLRVHTVHVQDAVGGIWFLACAGVNREIYNIVDKNDTTQKKINAILEEIFPIKTPSCVGHLKTQLFLSSGGNIEESVSDANHDHLIGWTELLKEHNLVGGPLTCFLHKEEVSGHPISADGSKLEALGYQVCFLFLFYIYSLCGNK